MILLRARLPSLLFAACASLLCAAPATALDRAFIDTSADPCRDFFEYANGAWIRAHPIPADRESWGVDQEIEQRNLDILKRTLERAATAHAARGSITQQIGDFYAAAMDETAIERAGIAPLRRELDEIAALRDSAGVAELIRNWHARGLDVAFELQALEDLEDSKTNIAYAGQGGLGLPDRGYYTRTDAKSALLRARYRSHVARMLALLGDHDAKNEADRVLSLETRLARASLDPLALRDPENSYHVYALADADALTPHFDWSALFAAVGRDDVRRFSLAQPDFFAALDAAIATVPVADWQGYLRWHLVDDAAAFLGKDFVDADFEFRGHVLRGVKANKPRWQRAIATSDAALGEALGQAYVAEAMPPQARERALELVTRLEAALRRRLANLDWMSEPTRAAALAKLDALAAKIGYPDHWRDYSTLVIEREAPYYANVRAALAFEAHRQFAKFDRAIDRDEWDMTPQTVNAYNNPMRNEIVFPAAQLLPPYFDAAADDAENYGAIGAVIGHEMLHAFDDQGSKFDARGNLSNWWSAQDRARFDAATAALVRQFDAYASVDGLHIDGRLTLGENIADLGGLLVAWDAFSAARRGTEATIAGLTPEQRFFVAYAQSWRTLQRPEQLRHQIQSDEHAPARWRVDGPLANVPQFAQAFGCKAGDAMVRGAAQVKIW